MANHCSFLALVILLTTYSSSSVFAWIPAAFVYPTSNTRTIKYNAKTSEDIEEEYKKHRLLNDPKGKEEEELLEPEEAEVLDAHGISDEGFEAAAMERPVMMAEELKEKTRGKEGTEPRSQGSMERAVQKMEKKSTTSEDTGLTVEEEKELLEAEDAAAFDAHDVSDPGLEAAAMERAVMMAEELKEGARVIKKPTRKSHGASERAVQKVEKTPTTSEDYVLTAEEEEELLEAEDSAAFDAHDVSDAGFEAAAMERAVMMAEELKEKMHAKKESKRRSHIAIMEKAAMDLEKIVEKAAKSHEEPLSHALFDFDDNDMALLILERATIKSAEEALMKAEKKYAESEARLKEAVEAKKIALATAAKAIEESQVTEKDTSMVEALEDKYEDLERRPVLSVSHAALHIAGEALEKALIAEKAEEDAKKDLTDAQERMRVLNDRKKSFEDDFEKLRLLESERKGKEMREF